MCSLHVVLLDLNQFQGFMLILNDIKLRILNQSSDLIGGVLVLYELCEKVIDVELWVAW